mgnify:CR=1 FL=1
MVDTNNSPGGKAVQLNAMKGNVLCAVKDADRNEIVFMCGYAPCYRDASSMIMRMWRCYSSSGVFLNVLGS